MEKRTIFIKRLAWINWKHSNFFLFFFFSFFFFFFCFLFFVFYFSFSLFHSLLYKIKQHEKFLSTFPSFNCFTSQTILTTSSLKEIMSMTFDQMVQKFPWIPSQFLVSLFFFFFFCLVKHQSVKKRKVFMNPLHNHSMKDVITIIQIWFNKNETNKEKKTNHRFQKFLHFFPHQTHFVA